MEYKRQVPWVEKLKALRPKKGSVAHSLLTIGQAASFVTLRAIDEVWCRIIPPNRRQS